MDGKVVIGCSGKTDMEETSELSSWLDGGDDICGGP